MQYKTGFWLLVAAILLLGCVQSVQNKQETTGNNSYGYPSGDQDRVKEIAEAPTQEPVGNANQSDWRAVEAVNATLPLQPMQEEEEVKEQSERVVWEYYPDRMEWEPNGVPPECPEPFIVKSPVDVNLPTSVLYPGQERGGNYKPHGGFRFDSLKNNSVEVRAPFDAYIVDGSRYYVDGEIQYMLDFENECGIRYRLGHMLKLAPKFAEIAEGFREPSEGDSRTTPTEPLLVKEGELIAIEIGFDGNAGMDFGVYDIRQRNDAAQDEEWLEQHEDGQAPYAVCWLDWMSAEESAVLKALPGADGINGKKSDYC